MAKSTRSTILITGAANRLGRELALACADAGYGVIAHYHKSKEDVLRLGQLFHKRALPFHAIPWDLSKSPKGLIAKAISLSPHPLLGLINNASLFEKGNLCTGETPTHKLWQVNAFSPLKLMQDFAHHVSDGVIINMLDANIHSFHPEFQAYRISKQMLKTFTLEMAALLAPAVRVHGLAPGAILPSKFSTQTQAKTPEGLMGNGGTTKDLQQGLRFLLTNPNLTGQILYIDGGLHLKNDKG